MSDERSQIWSKWYVTRAVGNQQLVVPLQVTLALNPNSGMEDNLRYADDAIDSMLGRGWLPDHPDILDKAAMEGLPPGAQVLTVTAVMRKEKPSDRTPILAFYGHDQRWKFVHWYLNDEFDYEYFARNTGLTVSDIPLYEGAGYHDRQHGPHEKEVRLPNPVRAVKAPKMRDGEPETFQGHVVWQFLGFLPTLLREAREEMYGEGAGGESDSVSSASAPSLPIPPWAIVEREVDAILATLRNQIAKFFSLSPKTESLNEYDATWVKNVAKRLGFSALSGSSVLRSYQVMAMYYTALLEASGDIEHQENADRYAAAANS